VRGRALLIEKQPAAAALCLDNAAGFYQKAQHYQDMAVALQNAGAAYEAADKRAEAINSYYRAARSLFLCNENTRAQEAFNKANELAKKSDDKQILNALARLKSETNRGAESEAPRGKPAEPSNTIPEKAQAE
jgi:tetratricopeptide (TPR) repeat protein